MVTLEPKIAVECLNVGKSHYNTRILQDINFKVLKGKVLLVSGPSGSGKSTLINLISGILLPTQGTISIFGYDTKSEYEKIKPLLSCAWNENSLFKKVALVNNLRFFSSLDGQDWNEARSKIEYLMHEFGIYYEKNKFVDNLSSGSQRKADLCRVLNSNSDLILLDEPSSSLDNKSKKKLIKILSEYKKEGKTMIIVSHHASLYSELVDNLLVLKNGKIIHNGSIETLVNESKEFKNSFNLKTSDRLKANEVLKNLPEIQRIYLSQKAIHIYLSDGVDIHSVINSLGVEGLRIKQIISKKPNLDKLIGDY